MRIVVLSYAFMGETYACVRMRVPYRPGSLDGGLDLGSGEDVMELFSRYVGDLGRMGYTSSTDRRYKKYATLEEKVLAEVRHHKTTNVLIPRDAPEWFTDIDFGSDVVVTKVAGTELREVEGVTSYLELQAWHRMVAWFDKVKIWDRLAKEGDVWSEPGKDVVGSHKARQRKGAGRKVAAGGRKAATKELEDITQEQIDAIKAGRDPEDVLGDRVLSKDERQMVANAREEAIMAEARAKRGRGRR